MTDQIHYQEEEYNKSFDLKTWKTLARHARPFLRDWIALAISAVIVAVCEGVFAMLPKYVIDAIANAHASKGGEAYKSVFTVLPADAVDAIRTALGDNADLWLLGGAYLVAALVFAWAIMAFIQQAGRLSTGVAHGVRRKAFEHLQDLSFSFYDRRPAGWLVARLTSDCDRVSRTLAWGTLDIIWGTCMVIGLAIIMLVFNWKLGLLVLTIMPPLIWLSAIFQRRILTANRAVRKQNSTITAAYSECISGVRTTKVLVREERNLGEFCDKTDVMYEQSVLMAILTSTYLPIVITLGSIAGGIALWGAGSKAIVALAGGQDADIGTLVLFITCSGMLVWPILEVARVLSDFQSTQAAAERIFGLIDTEPEIKDSPDVQAALAENASRPHDENTAPDGYDRQIQTVEFRDVSFAYVEDQTVLHDFNLTVQAGQTVALVGPTGGGKSTVVSLLCRFYEPTAGQILINGVEYRNRSLAWLQGNLGIVLQTPHLFNESIAENIRYGRLDATDDEVAHAAEQVHAHGFITESDEGYQTKVGEGGGSLSTGQKQLVSFARAVLADPQIFVMDEATSSVDTETERLIQDGLAGVLEGRISFIIAHRLSTIRSADIILVIDDGHIVEQGTHASLIAERGRYYNLYTNQFAEEQTSQLLARNDDETEVEKPEGD